MLATGSGCLTNNMSRLHDTIKENEPKTNTGIMKLPVIKLSAALAATFTFLLLFNSVVPSKAKVEELNSRVAELAVRQTALELARLQDHETLIKLERDIGYIRQWVEAQEPRWKGTPLKP